MTARLLAALAAIVIGATLAPPATAADYGTTRAIRLTADPCREHPLLEQPTGCLGVLVHTPRCRMVLIATWPDRWRTGPVTACPFTRADVVIWPDAAAGTKRVRYAVVEPRDNLYRIALHAYGDGHRWRLIKRANRIADVRALRVGQLLILPPAATT